MPHFLDNLRTGSVFPAARLHLWAGALLLSYIATIAFLFFTAHGLNDYQGRPLGSDFSNIYAAGIEANAGHPAQIYDPANHLQTEQAIFGKATPFYGWHYPPFLLLISTLLAHLPYLPAMLLWQAIGAIVYLLAMRQLIVARAPTLADNRTWMFFAVAFPAVFANVLAAHNGFLTAALLAGGLALLDTRPLFAGALLGLLAYKPQFGLMIPLVLIATQRWRVIGGAALSVAILTALCTALFGPDIWRAFASSEGFTRTVVLEQGGAGFFKILSVFAWVRMWHGSIAIAYALQGTVTMFCAVALVRQWRSDAPFEMKGASLCIAAILSTPYSLDYDLMALAPAIALLGVHGVRSGFGPYEKTAVIFLWLMPFLARAVPAATNIPVAVPAMLAMLLLTLRYTSADPTAGRLSSLAQA